MLVWSLVKDSHSISKKFVKKVKINFNKVKGTEARIGKNVNMLFFMCQFEINHEIYASFKVFPCVVLEKMKIKVLAIVSLWACHFQIRKLVKH